MLAGVFTEGALTQLRSLGFTVLYFPYESVIKAFAKFKVDASSDEATTDKEFQRKVNAFERLSTTERTQLAKSLVKLHSQDVKAFLKSLSVVVLRQIERIVILALHGQRHEVTTVGDALAFVSKYADNGRAKPIHRFEIEVRYNNGNVIIGRFNDKDGAMEFLRGFAPVVSNVE